MPSEFTNTAVDIQQIDPVMNQAFSDLSPHYPIVNRYVTLSSTAIALLIAMAIFYQPWFTLSVSWQINLSIVMAVIAGLGVISWVYHYFADPMKGFLLREHDLSYRHGLIFRKVVTQPIARIQHIELERGPIERKTGMATLQVFSAGGALHTFQIPGLPVEQAEQMRQLIFQVTRILIPMDELTEKTAQDAIQSEQEVTEQGASNEERQVIQNSQWRRVSPIAILYFLFNLVKHLAGNFVVLIPAYFALRERIEQDPLFWLSIIAGFIGLLVLFAILRFYFFQYRLNQGSIEIRSGVIEKKHLNLPFERVQNVKLEQPIYYRFADYVCLILDTAGSAKQEAKIVALPQAVADSMKQEILTFQKRVETPSIEADTSESEEQSDASEQVLITRSIPDLVVHGLTSNRIWILLGIAAPVYDDIAGKVADWLSSAGIDLASYFSTDTQSWWQIGLYALTLTMMIMAVLALFSVIGAIITFYNYRLCRTEDKYIRYSGLLTRHQVVMKLSRLQTIVQQQDWLDRLLGRINLKFEQIQAQGNQAATLNNKIIVPSIYQGEAQQLINDAFADAQSDVEYQSISRRYITRLVLMFGIPLTALFELVLWNWDALEHAIWGAAVFAVIVAASYLRWLRWGWAIDQQYLYLRKGFFGFDRFTVPLFKVQQVKRAQSAFMQRHQLATADFVLASGKLKIPFIPQQAVDQLLEFCLLKVESTNKSWM